VRMLGEAGTHNLPERKGASCAPFSFLTQDILMSASSLFSKLLALLSALLLLISTTLAYLLRRCSLELRALKNLAAHDHTGARLAIAERDRRLARYL